MVEVSITGRNLFRLIYITLAIVIVAFGVFSMITFGGGITAYMFRVYNIIFGLLLVLAEFNFEFMVKYFNFLKKKIGKGCFCILIATTVLNTDNWYSWGFAIGFATIGVIFIGMSFCFEESDEDDIYKNVKV